tara:strand:+ start:120 stop:245 length:126 start_codon:yes stop_codon:yes gene_type:complete
MKELFMTATILSFFEGIALAFALTSICVITWFLTEKKNDQD